MTTNEFIEKAQVLFKRLNNSYLELCKIYGFYDTDIWEGFDGIPSSEAEETIERFASIIPGMDSNTLYCFKRIFDWIEAAKNRVKPIELKYILPQKIETGKRYRIFSPTKEWHELYIQEESPNLNFVALIRKLEEIAHEWEAFIQTPKQQVDLLYYRMGM